MIDYSFSFICLKSSYSYVVLKSSIPMRGRIKESCWVITKMSLGDKIGVIGLGGGCYW